MKKILLLALTALMMVGCVKDGKVVKWTDADKSQFEREMWEKCNSYIHDLME